MILFQIYILVFVLVLAYQNATSYLFQDQSSNPPSMKTLNRWHTLNVVLNGIAIVPFLIYDLSNWWLYLIYAILIRLSIFDIAFNYFSNLDYRFLGTTAWADRFFAKIFGDKGAVKKGILFLIILIIINILWQQ